MTDHMTAYLSWRLSFPGSGTYTGRTPTDVLRRLSKVQWDKGDRRNIKAALAWRAWVMTETIIDPNVDDEAFLIDLAQAGVARLEAYGEERDEWLQF